MLAAGVRQLWATRTVVCRAFSTSRLLRAQAAPVSVFYGSQTGTAQAFAEEFASEGKGHGLACKVVDLRSFEPKQLTSGTKAVILAACYGMGEPTDNAKGFYQWLLSQERAPNSLKGVEYAVFGLGSKRTHSERFCVIGINIDKRMTELGATRIFDRVDGDDSDSIEFQFEDWKSGLLAKLEAASAEEAKAPAPAPTATEEAKPIAVKTNTFLEEASTRGKPTTPSQFFHYYTKNTFCHPTTELMHILENKELSPLSDRSTKEMRIAAKPGAYDTGDHLVVYPKNRPEVVDKLLSRLNFSRLGDWRGKNYVVKQASEKKIGPPVGHAPVTVEEMFANTIDVQANPTPRTLKVLAELCKSAAEKDSILSVLSPAAYKEQIVGRQVTLADLLKMYPSMDVPVEVAVELLPQLQPRYYSISSCPRMNDKEVHVTYRVVEYTNRFNQERRYGVCSTWLAGLKAGEELPAYFWQSTFKLPKDPSTPVILVAGGTGIAPFKGFLEDHQTSPVRREPMDLFYGVRDSKEFVYEDMLKKAKADGHFGHFGVCFSNEPGPNNSKPMFLDAFLRGYAKDLWERMERGAYVYVCGGAGGFGPSIVNVFKTSVLQEVGGLSAKAADEYFSNVLASGRYLEDLSD